MKLFFVIALSLIAVVAFANAQGGPEIGAGDFFGDLTSGIDGVAEGFVDAGEEALKKTTDEVFALTNSAFSGVFDGIDENIQSGIDDLTDGFGVSDGGTSGSSGGSGGSSGAPGGLVQPPAQSNV